MYFPAWRGSGGDRGGVSGPGFSMTWPEVPTVTNPAYTPNPAPITGQGAFGKVPGPVGLPDPFGDLSLRYDDLGGTNQALSKFIRSEIGGQLSPETQANIQDIGARFGQTSGMPLSGLARNRTARDLGLATEQLQRAGLQDYLNAIFGISKTQVNSPEFQYKVASENAEKSSAPDPKTQQTYAQNLYNSYLKQSSPAGGTGGYAGGYMGPNVGGIPFIMSQSTPSASSGSSGGWPWGDQVPGSTFPGQLAPLAKPMGSYDIDQEIDDYLNFTGPYSFE